jgi:hypothetical protein
MAILSLLTGVLLLLLGLMDLSDLQQALQAKNKAGYTGVLTEVQCSTERKQRAVKLRLAQHPSSTWFYTNRDLLGPLHPCAVLQRAVRTHAKIDFVASHSQILRLSIDNQQIFQVQDWRKHQLKSAIGLSVIGALLGSLGCYMLYWQQQRRLIHPEPD